MIGRSPEHCLMVGNDPVNDMAAARAGLHTYQTTDAADAGHPPLNMGKGLSPGADADRPEPDFTGPLSGVGDAVRQLMSA